MGFIGFLNKYKKLLVLAGLPVLLIVIAAIVLISNYIQHQPVSCDSPAALSLLKQTLQEHPTWTEDAFGIDPKKPFTVGSVTMYHLPDKKLGISYCQALINNSQLVTYELQKTVDGEGFTISISP
ncbi:MAG: hypothetical protein QXV17_08165 [Candidatus Micrarchaeaceae archaeon]